MVVLLGETGGMNDGSFGIKVPFFRTGRGASGHGSGRSDGGDRVLVVGAAVLRPQDRAGADRGAAVTVQGGAGAPVDDVVAAVAYGVQAPLLVVAAVPRRLNAGRAVGGVAPAVGDHPVGVVDDAVPPAAERHELPLQVGAAVPAPLLEVGPGRDAPAAVQHEAAGHVGDLHPAGGNGGRVQGGDLAGEGQLDHVGQGGERRVGRRHR